MGIINATSGLLSGVETVEWDAKTLEGVLNTVAGMIQLNEVTFSHEEQVSPKAKKITTSISS